MSRGGRLLPAANERSLADWCLEHVATRPVGAGPATTAKTLGLGHRLALFHVAQEAAAPTLAVTDDTAAGGDEYDDHPGEGDADLCAEVEGAVVGHKGVAGRGRGCGLNGLGRERWTGDRYGASFGGLLCAGRVEHGHVVGQHIVATGLEARLAFRKIVDPPRVAKVVASGRFGKVLPLNSLSKGATSSATQA